MDLEQLKARLSAMASTMDIILQSLEDESRTASTDGTVSQLFAEKVAGTYTDALANIQLQLKELGA